MLHKSRGIVFKSTEYGESSLVVQIYTELFGIQSYMVNSVRKKNARIHSNIFQPLTPVDLVVYHKERGGLQRISDIRPNPQLINIPSDIYKTSLIFFINEILCKALREEESNPELFEFILNSVLWLEDSENPGPDFHLLFILQLSRYMGFFPIGNYDTSTMIFNLREGHFQSRYPDHPNFIPPPLSGFFASMLNKQYSYSLNISNAERRQLINYLIEYFSLHIEGFGNVKSHGVLQEIFE